jgi:Glyoxalase-like domain
LLTLPDNRERESRAASRRCPLLTNPTVAHVRGAGLARTRAARPAFQGSTSASFYDQPVSLEWEQTVIDARDPGALGNWWREALGWVVVVNDDPDEFEIRSTPDRLPGLLFVPVPERKTIKNRLHLDFRPDNRDAEVERLLALGATRADVGQGEQSWVVLADREGNEFCVLESRDR